MTVPLALVLVHRAPDGPAPLRIGADRPAPRSRFDTWIDVGSIESITDGSRVRIRTKSGDEFHIVETVTEVLGLLRDAASIPTTTQPQETPP